MKVWGGGTCPRVESNRCESLLCTPFLCARTEGRKEETKKQRKEGRKEMKGGR
jgi:hypothetical protein